MPAPDFDVAVVGGGHNGLVCAGYLAMAGLRVVVLEQADRLGGGSRTDELLPGFRFDTHSVAHNIINMTTIPAELRLAEVGLDYVEMDPFSISVGADGGIVRFYRSIEATVASIRELAPADADRYADWMGDALPLIRLAVTGIEPARARSPRRLVDAVRVLRRFGGPQGLAGAVAAPYARLLRERFDSERVRAPIAAFAAHASASPAAPGSAMYGYWQAAYHLYGQWHARGGAQGLTDALVRRLESAGGEWRVDAPVARILRSGATVRGVRLESGAELPARAVVAAVDPRVALLDLLDPPLDGPAARRLRATHAGNAVQLLVHLAVDRLPGYRQARPGDWHGLQSYVDSLDALTAGFAAAEDRRLPDDPVPSYAFTTSALDRSVAPPGGHTVYLACPCAPYDVRGGWAEHAEPFAQRMVDVLESRAPGTRATIRGMSIRTPADMAAQLRWPGAHPMYLDISLDQLAFLRPTRELAGHATPVDGLFVGGAGTAPVGGVAGAPGRAAARAVLRRLGDRAR